MLKWRQETQINAIPKAIGKNYEKMKKQLKKSNKSEENKAS